MREIRRARSACYQSFRSRCRVRRAIACLQRRDERLHALAVRSFDHHDVAGTQRRHRSDSPEVGGNARPRLRASPAAGVEKMRASTARRRKADRPCCAPDRPPARHAGRAAVGPSSSMSPSTAMRRPPTPASSRRAARARRASRRDWRCSFRRSAGERVRPRVIERVRRSPRPSCGGRLRASAAAAWARSSADRRARRAAPPARSCAICRPGAPRRKRSVRPSARGARRAQTALPASKLQRAARRRRHRAPKLQHMPGRRPARCVQQRELRRRRG